jgi:DNA polymerase-3 subunit beta
MKIRMVRSELLTALQRVQGVVEKRTTMPVLSNLLIEAQGGGIQIFATDLEIGLKGAYEGEVLEQGAVSLSARKLYEIAKELPEGPVSLSVQENNWVLIEAGQGQFRIMGLSKEEYPTVPMLEESSTISVKRDLMLELIKKTIFAVGDNDARYILNGVLLHLDWTKEKKALRCVGTDGHRLAVIQRELGPQASGNGQDRDLIIPKKAVLELRRLLEEDSEDLALGFGKNQLVIQKKKITLFTRLMEGTYPNYQQVIPKENDKKVPVPRQDFEGALRRVAVLSREKTNAIKLSLEPGRLTLVASNPELGEAKEVMAVPYKGENVQTGFNARYLLDVLGAFETDQAVLEFKDSLSPCLVREGKDPGYLCVIMPMRV